MISKQVKCWSRHSPNGWGPVQSIVWSHLQELGITGGKEPKEPVP